MSYGKFGLLICCINDVSCWDPLKSCDIRPWWDTILEVGPKFVTPYQNWLRGSYIGRVTGDVIAGCGCWTNAEINKKNASSLAACYWLFSFKKSNISLEQVSEASALSVLTNIIMMAFFRIRFFAISLFLPGLIACWGWQMSI